MKKPPIREEFIYRVLQSALALGAVDATADFYEALQGTPWQLEMIVGDYVADHFVDEDGNRKGTELRKQFLKLGLKYRGDRYFLTIKAPYSSAANPAIGAKAAGIGDLELQLGPHFQRGQWYLLTTLEGKLPTGQHDSDKKLNPGNGNYEVGVMARVTRLGNYTSLDLGGGYTFEIDESVGTAHLRFTPAVNYNQWRLGLETVGSHTRNGDVTSDRLMTGPLLRYNFKSGPFVVFGVQKDVYRRNGPKGWLGTVRLRIPFGRKKNMNRKGRK